MKHIIPLFVFCFSLTFSQTKESIISAGNYYYGESTSEQEQEARDKALQRLIEQIAIKVSSANELNIVEKEGDIKQAYKSILNTYANATLNNVQSIKKKTENGIEVFCYIAKSEVTKIFEERKNLVRHIFEKAKECEREGNISDALKYYYFCIVLMNSIPDKNVEHQSKNLIVEIPDRINKLIAGTKFSLVSDKQIGEKERELQLQVTTLGNSVQQIDFSFWDGTSQVHVNAKDGIGVFRLYGGSASFDKLNIEVKYSYYESREEIQDVNDLWGLVARPSFKNSQTVYLKEEAKKPAQPKPSGKKFIVELINKENSPVVQNITTETEKFLDALDSKNIEKIKSAFGTDKFLYDKIIGLLKFNSPQLVEEPIRAEIHKTMTGWEVRKIRVLTFYPTINQQSGEYLILDFTKNGTLEDVNFGTISTLYDQFVQQGEFGDDWGNRQVIVKFVERYRTAYLTRNMQMLDSMFADEAVIIIGRELKKGKKRDDYQYSKLNESQPDFSYTQYTKQQYLKNQKQVFQNQKDISLGFSTFKIMRKNDTAGTYGISMKQHYTSSSYADEGHLFLLVDFLQEQPQIYVRSWQPHEWNENALIKLSNFKLNK